MTMDWLSLGTSLTRIGAPMLASLFLGPEAGALTTVVLNKLATTFGVSADPTAITNAINADPTTAQQSVAPIEAEHHDIIESYLADMANARAMTIDLSKGGSWMQYGAAVVSLVILLGYAGVCIAVVVGHMVENQLSLAVYGSVSAFAGTVVAFWLGSTKQSADKTDAVVNMARTVAPIAAKKAAR